MAQTTPRGEFRPRDLWHLPEILSIEASKVKYPQPRLYYTGPRPVLAREAVEILVRTAGPFPVRAWSPAIFVGEVAIVEYETVRSNLYRFLAYDITSLREGAPISLGWPQLPKQKVKTRFVYRLGGSRLVS